MGDSQGSFLVSLVDIGAAGSTTLSILVLLNKGSRSYPASDFTTKVGLVSSECSLLYSL